VASLEQTAYEIAVRTLAQQENAVNELRARTGTLLTASSLVASFLGGLSRVQARNEMAISALNRAFALAGAALLGEIAAFGISLGVS
jgi:hypothetical protein